MVFYCQKEYHVLSLPTGPPKQWKSKVIVLTFPSCCPHMFPSSWGSFVRIPNDEVPSLSEEEQHIRDMILAPAREGVI